MIDRKHNLPISKQAEALNISRGSVYYLPRPVPKTELAIMQVPIRRFAHAERFVGCRGAQDRPSACKCPFRNFLNRLNLLDSKEVV